MELIPVRLGTLRASQAVTFDVFIKIGDRHVHYLNQGDVFDAERHAGLKAKGVKKLFVPRESEPLYLAYLDAGLGQLKDAQVNFEVRTDLARDSMVMAAESAGERILSEAGFKVTENQVVQVMDFLLAEKGAMKQMLSTAGFASDVNQHAANVSSIAVKLASSLGIQGQDLTNLGIAALIHDIGKAELNLPWDKPRETLTPEEIIRYQKHPQAGIDRLMDKPHINKTILELVLNHEEMGEGAGFPNKKRISTLSKSQQILNLANEYDRVCTVNKVSPMDAIKQFYIDKLGLFDMELLKALSTLIKA